MSTKRITPDDIQENKPMPTIEQIEVMKLNQLKRIAASLEKISDSLELLEKLSDCVDEIPQYGSRLSIGGTVSADVR